MTFTTLSFVLLLLALFPTYWAIRNRQAQNTLLVLASYLFYAWWDWRFCGLLAGSSLIDFIVGLGLARTHSRGGRRAWLGLSLAVNLGLLGFFKYFGFFTQSLSRALAPLGVELGPVMLEIVLPVGISFYTFQTLSYTIDVYRRKVAATSALVDYLAYVSFFPQLVAGPIERATHLLPQFQRDRRFDDETARDGLRLILWGFFRKIAIAEPLAQIVDPVYARLDAFPGPVIALATAAFAFQIYYDFAAYSDIAIGTARLFGFDLMRNFATPYLSSSLSEFWRRWHISLSTWFRDYVYIPLGGSRVGAVKVARNLMVTFVLSGFWHGASWTFVAWGALMGAVLLLEERLGGDSRRGARDVPLGEGRPAARELVGVARTFFVVCAGWVFFRARSIEDAGVAFAKMTADLLSPEAWAGLAAHIGELEVAWVLPAVVVVNLVEWMQRSRPHPLTLPEWNVGLRWSLYTLLLWGTLFVGPRENSPFIYFAF